MKYSFLFSYLFLVTVFLSAQESVTKNAFSQVPSVYTNIVADAEGALFFVPITGGKEAPLLEEQNFFTLDNIRITPEGSQNGLVFDFKNDSFNGTIYYGMFSNEQHKYPQEVYFRKSAWIKGGKAEINIAQLSGKYDIAKLDEIGNAKIGYRITNTFGKIIYNGRLNVEGNGPYSPGLSIVEGPFINKVSEYEVVISFTTNKPCSPEIEVNDKKYQAIQMMGNPIGDIHHEIRIHHLEAGTTYPYTVHYGIYQETYSFKTAPKAGSREPFIFGYTSDCRAGSGGGEREVYGVNTYIMKKVAALAAYENAAFFQFTGDMINGYSSNIGETQLQYANFKRTIEHWWHHLPFNIGPGNHEAVVAIFDDGSKYGVQIDKFPFNTKSAERIFADAFVNPENGPFSEDDSKYDPKANRQDFPPYKETVY